jgi:trimethylamine--corrinoid protein Co-methyltransferase
VRPSLTILDPALIPDVLAEARRILAQIGVDVQGTGLRARLLEAGLRPDAGTGRLRFPDAVVDQALATVPRTIRLFDRDGSHRAELGSGRTCFVPGSSGLRVLDHRTGTTRDALTADLVEAIRVADGLPGIDHLATAFSTVDVPPAIADAWRLALVLGQSRAPVVTGAFTEHGVPRMRELLGLFRRDAADLATRPQAVFTVTPTGAFRYGDDSCQNLLDCAEAGIPVEIVPVTLMGLIAPVTPVGAAVFHAADALAGVVMTQLVRPGAPVLWGAAPATFHMQLATSPMAAVEAMRVAVMSTELGRALGIPTQAYLAFSESKVLDAQAGAETATGALLAALAGVDQVAGPGMLDYLLAFSLPKLILDAELCTQARHLVRDVRPMDDLPALDLVRELLAEGQLMIADQTLRHWPAELHLPGPVIDRDNRDRWVAAGSRDTLARATDEVERRLAAWQPDAVPEPAVLGELRRIVASGLAPGERLPRSVLEP